MIKTRIEECCKSAFLTSELEEPLPFSESYSFGIDTSKYQNLAAVTQNTLIFATSNVIKVLYVQQEELHSVENDSIGGVSCLQLSNNKKQLAVGYSHPDGAYIKVFNIEEPENVLKDVKCIRLMDFALIESQIIHLPEPLEQSVQTLTFNAGDQLLACVSTQPDYNLYVFNIESAHLELKAKAYTAPVLTIRFNRYTPSSLITGGRNHVKFWQMAETFTGSKLKGELGKFGALSQSDVSGFVELPCGSYLTGCGYGEIAMWESVNVRLVFRISESKNCHDGAIEVLQIDTNGVWSQNRPELLKKLELSGIPNQQDGWWQSTNDNIDSEEERPIPMIISAGSDGYIKIWSGHQMMQSQYVENENESMFFNIEPLEEIYLGEKINIRDIVYSPDQNFAYIVDAGNGGIIKYDIQEREAQRLEYGHGGAVKSIAIANTITDQQLINASSNDNIVRSSLTATIGGSGILFLHDEVNNELVEVKTTAGQHATKCIFIHDNLCLVVGYEDGSVRFFSILVDEKAENDEICYLIGNFKCFNNQIVDLSCSSAGVLLALDALGNTFVFSTSLRLLKKEEEFISKDISSSKMNSLEQSLVNIAIETENFDDQARKEAELARRNAKGKLGICQLDIEPICSLNCLKLAFSSTEISFKCVFWIDSTTFAFVTSGDASENKKIVLFKLPSLESISKHRSSHPEQILESTLFNEQQHSLVSFDVSSLLTEDMIKYVNIHIPPSALPNRVEGTISKYEQQLMQSKITAMLPSKSALENAMAALQEMGEEEGEEEEKEKDEIAELLKKAKGEVEQEKPKKKKRTGLHDPLDEDVKESIKYYFKQFSICKGEGRATADNEPTDKSGKFEIQALLDVQVDEEIRNRADNAMDALRARAEAAEQGISIAQGADDPAIASAALQVAELRASYRSSLLYKFDFEKLEEFALSDEEEYTLTPFSIIPVNMPSRLISVNLLEEEEIEDESFKIDRIEAPKVLISRPLKAYQFRIDNIQQYCSKDQYESAMKELKYSAPSSIICSIVSNGDLVMEVHEQEESSDQDIQYPKAIYSIAQLESPLCQLEVGFGGHLICVGDELGNYFSYESLEFYKLCLLSNLQQKFLAESCHFCFTMDSIWSTGNAPIQLNKDVPFFEEVYSLLPKNSKIEQNSTTQTTIEVFDQIQAKTIEEQRLLALDNANQLKGIESQAGVQAKLDGLRSRYELLMKENENEPPNRRLLAHEIEPDLQLSMQYISREEARAFDVLQNELGTQLGRTIGKIFAIEKSFPIMKSAMCVRQFATTGTRVCTFEVSHLPEDFTAQLCRALGVDSLDELEQIESENTTAVSESVEFTEHAAEECDVSAVSQEHLCEKKRPRTLRPVDKIVRQLLAEKAGKILHDDAEVDDFNNKRERIAKRAQAREERRRKFQELLDAAPNPRQIHPDDQLTIEQAQKTVGEFPLKIEDDYITIVQRIAEEQERVRKSSPEDAADVNPQENKEAKWLEFLFTLKGLEDAKGEFNARVGVLFAHKQAIIAVVEELREQLLSISAQIKLMVGPRLAAELDALQQEFIQPDFITSFVELHPEEETFIYRERMDEFFNRFIESHKIKELIANSRGNAGGAQALFQQLSVGLGELFGASTDFDRLTNNYISEIASAKIITSEEAKSLKHALQTPHISREDVIARAVADCGGSEPPREQREQIGELERGSEPAAHTSAFRDVMHEIYQQVLSAETQTLTTQQLQSYDFARLINAYAKSSVSAYTQARNSQAVRVLLLTRRIICEKIENLVKTFDACVVDLAQQQLYLQADFCRIRIRLVNLFEECEIHHLYVKKDADCLKNLDNCKQDHVKLSEEMDLLQKQIISKIEAAKQVEEELLTLQQQFDEIVPRDASYRLKLLKLYCKKEKLLKVVQNKDSDDESSSLSDGDSDQGDDEIIDETVPPEGCGAEVFKFVLDLREKKRNCDQELMQIQVSAEQLKESHSQLEKREKQILTNIEAANRELTSFRSLKQKELNAIPTASLVELSQICSMKDGKLQKDLDQSLLFDNYELNTLYQRIEARKKEIEGLQRISVELKENYAQSLAKEHEEQAELELLQQKLVSVQNLKFGRTVDIAKLDGVAINEQASALQKEVDIEEKQHLDRLKCNDKLLLTQKEDLRKAQILNTELVAELTMLEKESLVLDKSILQGQKQPPKAWCSDNKHELIREEYNNLKQAIVDRERELRGLVDEISLLKNHGAQ